MANVKLDWSGARGNQIAGYQIDYKLSGNPTWGLLVDIPSTNGSGTYTWSGASYNKSYDFRIRTKDNYVPTRYSDYHEILNFSTVKDGNLPPLNPTSYAVVNNNSQLVITFNGASDDFGIKGYEVSYKKSTDTTWILKPFITTSDTIFSTTISPLLNNTSYDVRVRTLDIYDIWSVDYYSLTETTAIPLSFYEFNRSQQNLSPSELESGCGLGFTLSQLYCDKSGFELTIGDILYTDSALTVPFNGNSRVWHIRDFLYDIEYSVLVNSSGIILDMVNCGF